MYLPPLGMYEHAANIFCDFIAIALCASSADLNNSSAKLNVSTKVTVSSSSGIQSKVAMSHPAFLRKSRLVGGSQAGAFEATNRISVMPCIH